MKGACSMALLCLAMGGQAFAQSDAQSVTPIPQDQQGDDLQAMEEQRAALQKELQQLREELAASEARMEASRERVRQLQSQQTSKP